MTRARRALWATLALACVAGCGYYSTSGGVPSHINTVGVEFFENATVETGLEEQLNRALSDLIVSQAQYRYGSARAADAVIRGRIVRFVDEPLTYTPGQASRYQITVFVNAEAWDRVRRRALWQRDDVPGRGTYDPAGGQTARQAAFSAAFSEVARVVVDGMSSGW